MKEIDKEGLLTCVFQGHLFENSIALFKGSSSVFIKTFMQSETAAHLDRHSILHESIDIENVLSEFQTKFKGRGSKKYDDEVMFWVGYTYRYWCYTYGISSRRAFSIISGSEMALLFQPYHTMDCAKAIERIMEAKPLK